MDASAAFDVLRMAVAPALPDNVFERLPTYEALSTAGQALAKSARAHEKRLILDQLSSLQKLTAAIRDVDALQLSLFPENQEGACK